MGLFRQLDIDLNLLQALKAGDESALRVLFEKNSRKILYYAKSIVKKQEVAEEIVADSIVKLWQQRETFETTDSVNAFLYVVIRNLGINYVKSSYASQQFDYDIDENLESADPDTFVKIVRAELLQSIYNEVAKLPEKQREVFRLTYFEDLSTDEICEKLGMSAAAVFTNRSRAVESLRLVFKGREMWLCVTVLNMLISRYQDQLSMIDTLFIE